MNTIEDIIANIPSIDKQCKIKSHTISHPIIILKEVTGETGILKLEDGFHTLIQDIQVTLIFPLTVL